MLSSATLAIALRNKDSKQIEKHAEEKISLLPKDYNTAFCAKPLTSKDLSDLLRLCSVLPIPVETILFTLLWTNKLSTQSEVQLNNVDFSGCPEMTSPIEYSVRCCDASAVEYLISKGAKQRPLSSIISSLSCHEEFTRAGSFLSDITELKKRIDKQINEEKYKPFIETMVKITSLFLKNPTEDLDSQIKYLKKWSDNYSRNIRILFIWLIIEGAHDLILHSHFQKLIRSFQNCYLEALLFAVLFQEKFDTYQLIKHSLPFVNDRALRLIISTAAANNDLELLMDLTEDIKALSKPLNTLIGQEMDETNPLWLAFRYKNRIIVSFLLENGVNPHGLKMTPGYSTSYLHKSVFDKDIRFVNRFLKAGISINNKDSNGQTPLHVACTEKNTSFAKLVIAKGADITRNDDRKKTPFDYINDDSIKKELVEYSSFIEKQNIFLFGLFGSDGSSLSSLKTFSKDESFDRNLVNIVSDFLRPK
jgi:ankyrin repeat protein